MDEHESGSYWIEKSKTAFGKRTVNGIRDWIDSVGSPRLTFRRGGQLDYVKIDGKSHIKMYYAPDFPTFFLMVHGPKDLETLKSRLTHPEHINPNGQGGAIKFRLYHDRDLDIVKELLLQRIGGVPDAASPIGNRNDAERPDGNESSTPPVRSSVDIASDAPAPDAAPDIAARGLDVEVGELFPGDEEGRERLVLHRKRERSERNRREAIRIHGTVCKVCGFDFNRVYGETVGRNYIEIHHVRPLSETVGVVNPETDLIPLCSNCHSVIHIHRDRVLSVEELQMQVKKASAYR